MRKIDYVSLLSEMLMFIALTFLIFGYVLAQDPNCDFYQNVGAQERYFISSPNYPNNYSAGTQCRYIARCPNGYNCRVDCNLSMPWSPDCSADRLLISKTGDPTLTGAEAYCGRRTISVLSTGTNLTCGLIADRYSRGGKFICNLTAQPAPTPQPTVCRCGEKKQFRIVGGQETRPNEYPMMAALIDRSTSMIQCGAVIISNRYVLLAAHCVYNYKGILFITVGASNNSGNSGTPYNIKRFIIHENYNPSNYDYDIALVELQSLIPDVQPACLPFKFTNTDFTGRNVTILGWGTTSFGGPVSENLREADVTVRSPTTCNVTPRQFCTYARGKDSCQFDSGGPVLYTDRSNGLLYNIGVISNGDGCASTEAGVNTDVAVLLRWIINNANSAFCIKR